MKIEITKGVETPVTKFFSTTPETDVAEYYIQGEGNYVRSDISRKLERKLADALSKRDEAREEAAHWKTEYGIVVARLCGRKHPRDNGIIFEHEVIPRLKELVYAWESRWKAEVEFAAKERELRKKAEQERDEAREQIAKLRDIAERAIDECWFWSDKAKNIQADWDKLNEEGAK